MDQLHRSIREPPKSKVNFSKESSIQNALRITNNELKQFALSSRKFGQQQVSKKLFQSEAYQDPNKTDLKNSSIRTVLNNTQSCNFSKQKFQKGTSSMRLHNLIRKQSIQNSIFGNLSDAAEIHYKQQTGKSKDLKTTKEFNFTFLNKYKVWIFFKEFQKANTSDNISISSTARKSNCLEIRVEPTCDNTEHVEHPYSIHYNHTKIHYFVEFNDARIDSKTNGIIKNCLQLYEYLYDNLCQTKQQTETISKSNPSESTSKNGNIFSIEQVIEEESDEQNQIENIQIKLLLKSRSKFVQKLQKKTILIIEPIKYGQKKKENQIAKLKKIEKLKQQLSKLVSETIKNDAVLTENQSGYNQLKQHLENLNREIEMEKRSRNNLGLRSNGLQKHLLQQKIMLEQKKSKLEKLTQQFHRNNRKIKQLEQQYNQKRVLAQTRRPRVDKKIQKKQENYLNFQEMHNPQNLTKTVKFEGVEQTIAPINYLTVTNNSKERRKYSDEPDMHDIMKLLAQTFQLNKSVMENIDKQRVNIENEKKQIITQSKKQIIKQETNTSQIKLKKPISFQTDSDKSNKAQSIKQKPTSEQSSSCNNNNPEKKKKKKKRNKLKKKMSILHLNIPAPIQQMDSYLERSQNKSVENEDEQYDSQHRSISFNSNKPTHQPEILSWIKKQSSRKEQDVINKQQQYSPKFHNVKNDNQFKNLKSKQSSQCTNQDMLAQFQSKLQLINSNRYEIPQNNLKSSSQQSQDAQSAHTDPLRTSMKMTKITRSISINNPLLHSGSSSGMQQPHSPLFQKSDANNNSYIYSEKVSPNSKSKLKIKQVIHQFDINFANETLIEKHFEIQFKQMGDKYHKLVKKIGQSQYIQLVTLNPLPNIIQNIQFILNIQMYFKIVQSSQKNIIIGLVTQQCKDVQSSYFKKGSISYNLFDNSVQCIELQNAQESFSSAPNHSLSYDFDEFGSIIKMQICNQFVSWYVFNQSQYFPDSETQGHLLNRIQLPKQFIRKKLYAKIQMIDAGDIIEIL